MLSREAWVSIHAPGEGSDLHGADLDGANLVFHSTLPVKGATPPTSHRPFDPLVSIHAPGEGSDLIMRITAVTTAMFQSTLPVKGATRFALPAADGRKFQSTLPVKGATTAEAASVAVVCSFNPRSR